MKNFFQYFDGLGFNPEGLKKYLANTSWLITERILRLVLAFITTILIVRYLGPEKFGVLSYAISLVSLVSILAYAGLENILTRELVKAPEKSNEILGTGFVMRSIGSVLVIVIIFIAGIFTNETKENFTIILIVGAANIFQPFGVIDFYFQSKVQAKYSVIVQSVSFLMLTIARIISIYLQAPLIVFAILLSVEIFFAGVGYILAYSFQKRSIFLWKFNRHIALEFLRDSWPLVLSGLAVSTFAKIDQVLLKFMVDEKGVGLYSAAVRIVEAWYFIPMAITTSIFPAILNAKQNSIEKYQERLGKLYDLMSYISISIAFLLSLLSGIIINSFYGFEYRDSSLVLTIYIWSGVATFLGVASNQFLIAENLTRLSLYRSLFGMITNIGLNLYLIPIYGIYGAAWATLISYFLSTFFIVINKKGRAQVKLMLNSILLLNFFSFLISKMKTRQEKQ
jgi:O-antigen/teichoic acid export membrane protein